MAVCTLRDCRTALNALKLLAGNTDKDVFTLTDRFFQVNIIDVEYRYFLYDTYSQSTFSIQMAEKLEDLNLPNAVVTRIMKEALPDGVTVAKEARAAVAKAASIFILYLTSSANMIAKKSNRKTVSGQDVIQAMEDIEFEQFIEPLQEALENFKKNQKEKKDASSKKKQQKKDEDDTEIQDDE